MTITAEMIQQALANTRRPGRTHAAKLRDAIAHTHIKNPDIAGGGYRALEICRNADDTENNNSSCR